MCAMGQGTGLLAGDFGALGASGGLRIKTVRQELKGADSFRIHLPWRMWLLQPCATAALLEAQNTGDCSSCCPRTGLPRQDLNCVQRRTRICQQTYFRWSIFQANLKFPHMLWCKRWRPIFSNSYRRVLSKSMRPVPCRRHILSF